MVPASSLKSDRPTAAAKSTRARLPPKLAAASINVATAPQTTVIWPAHFHPNANASAVYGPLISTGKLPARIVTIATVANANSVTWVVSRPLAIRRSVAACTACLTR